MFYSTLLLAATAFTGLVSAQATNYSQSGPFNVTPSSVPYDTRLSWCRAQQNSCPELCGGQAYPNQCDPNALSYTCTCTNGLQPNISNYAETLPSLLCEQWVIDCVAAHPNDLDGITACHSVMCGSMNVSEASTSQSSSSSAASSMATATSSSGSGSGGAAGASATSSSGGSGSTASSTASSAASSSSAASAAVANIAMNYGTGILATAMLAVFGLAL